MPKPCVISKLVIVALVINGAYLSAGQESPPQQNPPDSALEETLKQLQQQVQELRTAVVEMKAESERYREETLELRRELNEAVRQRSTGTAVASAVTPETKIAGSIPTQENPSNTQPTPKSTQDRIGKLEEEYQLLTGQLSEQYQTKVESASRYRIRLSGVALFNLFSNSGTVDNLDVPFVARGTPAGQSNGSFGATFRQSQVGLQVLGPELAGARTRGDVQLDFAGGFPDTPNGATLGLVRLRTGTVRLDWPNTSIVAGQDTPFVSPLSPTSVASLATPALSYTGNLWTWVPQLRIEHRFALSNDSQVMLQGGILDSLTGEPPSEQFDRNPTAGESSRQPGYATRISWTRNAFGRPMTFGTGGYYSRQNWAFGRNVDSWAGTADWSIPLGRWFSLQGEFYRGRALGGLGAAFDRSVIFSAPQGESTSQVRGLDVTGGWSQLKFQPVSKLEFNTAIGQDNPFAGEIRRFPFSQSYYLSAALARNASTLFNVIYRPRSDLLLSLEYRHIRSFQLENTLYTADHLNLVMGVLF